jgi:hypothetical protein
MGKGGGQLPPLLKLRKCIMKFKYNGIRVADRGEVRDFPEEKLTDVKLKRLKDKGWEEIVEDPKPKPKPKSKK